MCAIERFEITVSLLIREKAFAAISNDRYHRSRQTFRERKSCKYHFISTLCSQTAFPQLSSRQRSLDSDTQTVSRVESKYEIAVAFILTLMRSFLYTPSCTVSPSIDDHPRRLNCISKQSIDTVTGHEYYRRNGPATVQGYEYFLERELCNA